MIEFKFVIPTRGRVDNQLTLQNLPEWLHSKCIIVCPKNEERAHRKNWPACKVVAQPARIKTLNDKIEWIVKNIDAEYLWMLDDDLFRIWVFDPKTEKYSRAREVPRLAKMAFTKKLQALMRKYDAVGFGGRLYSHLWHGGEKLNKRIAVAYGTNRKVRKSLDWNRVEDYGDTDFSLQMIRKGFTIATTYAIISKQRGEGLAGGLSDERTAARMARSKKQLQKLHPGIITSRPTTPQHPVSDLRVAWARAEQEGAEVRTKKAKKK